MSRVSEYGYAQRCWWCAAVLTEADTPHFCLACQPTLTARTAPAIDGWFTVSTRLYPQDDLCPVATFASYVDALDYAHRLLALPGWNADVFLGEHGEEERCFLDTVSPEKTAGIRPR